jgi:hypothetical protein
MPDRAECPAIAIATIRIRRNVANLTAGVRYAGFPDTVATGRRRSDTIKLRPGHLEKLESNL